MDNEKLFEKREKVFTTILSREELKDIIYADNHNPDNRFLPPDKGGVFYYFDLQELINPFNQDEMVFPVVKENDLIVGIIDMEYSPNQDSIVWVKGVSVDPKYQDKGYGSKLLEEMFRYAKEHNLTLQISSFTGDGERKIKKPIERLAKEYGVKIIDNN